MNGMAKRWGGVALVALLSAPNVCGAQAAGPVEVPLRVAGGQLLVPVRAADGTEMEFALSTGNTTTVLSQSTAARLAGQTELRLGGISVPLAGYATVPDADLTVDGKAVAGMVASNTLSAYDVLIDAPGRRLVLKPVGRSVVWEGMTLSEPVKLRVYHGLILGLDVTVNGVAFGAILDVGTRAMVINTPGAAKAGVAAQDKASVGLGSVTLADLPIRVMDLPMFQQADPNGTGYVLVGAAVARDCAISLSWLHQEMRTCVR